MIQRPFDLVCFDLGGVVVRICYTWKEGCAAAGLDFRADLPANDQQRQAWHELGKLYQTGRIDCDTFAKCISQSVDGLYTPEEITKVNAAWILGEYEGMSDLIQDVNDSGYQTAALSNSCHAHWEHLPHLHAPSRLGDCVSSHHLGLIKPEAAIYRAFETKLGISGERIIFFDDLEENVRGAQDIGWTAVHINSAGSPPQQIRAVLQKYGMLNNS